MVFFILPDKKLESPPVITTIKLSKRLLYCFINPSISNFIPPKTPISRDDMVSSAMNFFG